jgi:hypothetical protein
MPQFPKTPTHSFIAYKLYNYASIFPLHNGKKYKLNTIMAPLNEEFGIF